MSPGDSRTVYSTESGRMCPRCGYAVSACRCQKETSRSRGDGIIRIALDRKGRGGKSVTLVTGLSGSDDALKQLAAELKRRCGTGGTLKDGVIEIQGDHRDTLLELLRAKGFTVKRSGG